MKLKAGLFLLAVSLLLLYCACNKEVNSSPADADIYKVATAFLCSETNAKPSEVYCDSSFKIDQDPDSTYTVGMFVKLKNITTINIPEKDMRDSYTLTLKYKGGNPQDMKSWLIQDIGYDE